MLQLRTGGRQGGPDLGQGGGRVRREMRGQSGGLLAQGRFGLSRQDPGQRRFAGRHGIGCRRVGRIGG
ncbi:hypothetical protein, partial [Saccharomonospora xinjiangensis]|uniref:hypothetical protein n=1 Tax=Saccharomonospora xinjiangensis TaxID=75294 RepID=UPI001E42B8CF